MKEAQLLKLEAARDDAARKMQQALDDRAVLEAAWPEHPATAIVEAKRQLERMAQAWSVMRDWAAQEIRSEAERDLLRPGRRQVRWCLPIT